MSKPGNNESLYLYHDTWRFEVVLTGRHLVALETFLGSWLSWFSPPELNAALGRILNTARGSLQSTPIPGARMF